MFNGFRRINEFGFTKFSRLKDFDYKIEDESYMLKMEQLFLLNNSIFAYDNLPDSIQLTMGQRNYFDAMLFFQPSICFFKDKNLGVQCLPTTGEYKFNIVGRPIQWTARAFTGKTWDLNEKNSVLMFNDEAMSVPFMQLDYNVRMWVEAEETLKQNLFAQRQPLIVETDEETLKTAEALTSQIEHFKPIIFKRKPFKRDTTTVETKVFQTGVPLIVKDMDDIGAVYFNKCLTYLGINNINVQDKKERLITSEASANDILIQTFYSSKYRMREEAFKKVNEMFGTDINFKARDLESLKSAVQTAYQNTTFNQGGFNNDNNSR